MSREHQQLVIDALPFENRQQRVIAFIPGLVPMFGINATLLLCQLLHWYGLGIRRDGLIWKTVQEMEKETKLSRSKQKTAVDTLVEAGIVTLTHKGIPPKRHFDIDIEELLYKVRVFYGLNSEKCDEQVAGNQPYITDSTQHSTRTDSTQESTSQVVEGEFERETQITSKDLALIETLLKKNSLSNTPGNGNV